MMIPVQNLVALFEKDYVDYMDAFSNDAPVLVTAEYRKEVLIPVPG